VYNGRVTVLIIEDEVELRDSMREVLVHAGYQVDVAGDGLEAMRSMQQHIPSLVILDLRLPFLNGNEIYDVMQRTPALAKVPVLVTTADPTRTPRGVPTLEKPVDIDELLEMVALAYRS
jgi:DNA-binding response OmpR family regulator